MRNIKLVLAYDGTEYCGWQVQPGRATVQGTVRQALEKITQQPVVLQGAGRTDAGVHAWGQAANFHTDSRLSPEELARALNALLPPSVRIRRAEEAAPDFDARRSATAKTYLYRIDRAPVLSPFVNRYVLHEPHPLDFGAMAAAAQAFIGEHDFAAFAASSGSEETDQDRITTRTVFNSEMIRAGRAWISEAARAGWCPAQLREELRPGQEPGEENASSPLEDGGFLPGPDEWVYVIRGRSFLRHMVRKIAGTILEAGRGRLHPDDVARILCLRDPTRSGPTAPARGLCLMSVEYGQPAAEQ